MNNVELSKLFIKVCTNAYSAVEVVRGERRARLYRRSDLSMWAKEAFENGENYFYCEPVDPVNQYGKLQKCEPHYEYKMVRNLTVEEYESLFSNKDELEESDENV